MQVVTGLLIAEVNVNTMCELGSGGVSLVILCSFILFRIVYILIKLEIVPLLPWQPEFGNEFISMVNQVISKFHLTPFYDIAKLSYHHSNQIKYHV